MTQPPDPNQPGQPNGSPPPWEAAPPVPPASGTYQRGPEGFTPPASGHRTMRQNPDGSWSPAEPLGVQPVPKKRSWFARHKVLTAVLGVLGLLIVLSGIGAAVGGGTDPDAKPVAVSTPSDSGEPGLGTPGPASSNEADGVQETTPPAPTVAAEHTANRKDFSITLKIKGKDCFGDAGCNVTYEPKLTIIGPDLDENGSYEITYEVRGGTDGAAVDTIEVDGGQYTTGEGFAQTARSSSKLTAVVTEVETN